MSDRGLRVATAVVALTGIAIAGYLTWAHFSDSAVVCVRGGGCETVQRSSYSEVAGAPVALLGLVAYSTLLSLVLWDSPSARMAAAAVALVAVLFSVYLLVLQVFVIDAICIWCVANDVLVAPLLAVLTALRLRSQ